MAATEGTLTMPRQSVGLPAWIESGIVRIASAHSAISVTPVAGHHEATVESDGE